MKINLESTTRIVEINGVPARIWQGITEDGIAIFAAVTRVAVEQKQDQSNFEKELDKCPATDPLPGADVAFPLKMVI